MWQVSLGQVFIPLKSVTLNLLFRMILGLFTFVSFHKLGFSYTSHIPISPSLKPNPEYDNTEKIILIKHYHHNHSNHTCTSGDCY